MEFLENVWRVSHISVNNTALVSALKRSVKYVSVLDTLCYIGFSFMASFLSLTIAKYKIFKINTKSSDILSHSGHSSLIMVSDFPHRLHF